MYDICIIDVFIALEESPDGYRKGMNLWALTKRALPVMTNLKHLYMFSILSGNSMAEVMLVDCAFQLETLIWRCDEDSKEALIKFLQTQRVLTHLEVGDYFEKYDLSWLTPDTCPNLTSTTCKTRSVGHLECRQNVVALKSDIPDDIDDLQQFQNKIPSVLDRIKYLSISDYIYPRPRRLLWPVSQNVTLVPPSSSPILSSVRKSIRMLIHASGEGTTAGGWCFRGQT